MEIKKKLIKKVKDISHMMGVELSKYEDPATRARTAGFDKWETLTEFLIIHFQRLKIETATKAENEFMAFVIDHFRQSKSQIFQDLLVLFLFKKKTNGYFVEFGATNGISFSNSFLLENGFSWRGILAEPGITWHKELATNRNCKIDHRCVWEVTGEKLVFNETECAELSTVTEFTGKDSLASARINKNSYNVETISLNDLLAHHDAPAIIDFMSVDTEGSEFKILNKFDFKKYSVGFLCIEHNFSEPTRSEIYQLMAKNGFERVFLEYSHCDDWYINSTLSASLKGL